ncbi:MAG: hypothetical protein RRY78_06550, partial [Clostridia bacterium]
MKFKSQTKLALKFASKSFDKVVAIIVVLVITLSLFIVAINSLMLDQEEIALKALKEYNIRNLSLRLYNIDYKVPLKDLAKVEQKSGEKFYKIYKKNEYIKFGTAKDEIMFPYDSSGFFVAEEEALKELDCKLLAGKYPQTSQ